MAISLSAIWLANRPPSSGRSFGWYRLEILAAAANALLLLGVSLFVLIEGLRRLMAPPEIDSGVVIAVTGFAGSDAVASLLIGVMILPRTWSLLRDSVDVLLEATPNGVDLGEVRRHILEAPGVDASTICMPGRSPAG